VPQQENRERFDEAVDVMLRAWTEERFSHEGRFFTIGEARLIPKPWQRPHPPIYQVCGSDDGIESSAARGWPMLNSLLTGPVDQLVKRRDSYLTALRKHGRTEAEIAGLMADWGVSRQIYVADTDAQALAEAKDAEMWYQDSLRRFQVPERIEDAHPSLQPGFRAAAERFKKVTWEGLVAETVAFGSPDTVARHIQTMRDMGIGHVLCWMNFGGRAAAGLYCSAHGVQRVVPVHQRLPGGIRPPGGDLPLPHLRGPARGPARHGGAAVPLRRGLDPALRRPLPPQHLSLRLRGVGQEGVGGALHRQREHRVDVR